MNISPLGHFIIVRLLALFLIGQVWVVNAQWSSQTVSLQPGWNAVFFEVQPEPRECEAVFAQLQVESVWRWNRRFNPVEFIQDPSTLAPQQPDWLVYLPPAHPIAGQSTLFTIDGGRAYLIKLPDAAAVTNWTVHGKAIVKSVEWISDSMNFVGFTLPANTPSSFQNFFAASPSHTNQTILRLNALGRWQSIAATSLMRRGEAFWIRCKGHSDFQGPLAVTLAQRTGLDYGRVLVEQTLKIKNTSSSLRTIQLKKLDSENVPAGVFPTLAGSVPLNYWKFDVVNNVAGWQPLPANLSTSLLPGQEWEVRLEAKRMEMAAPPAASESLYQSVLEVTDTGNSIRLVVPVTAEGMQQPGIGSPVRRAGLWVGSAEITMVNQPSANNASNPLPTASSFQFRLLVHVDGAGQAKLLQKVLQMWKPGTYRTNDSGIREVDQPGRFVLVNDDRLISSFTGAALSDGEPVARRFSSAAFSFRSPIAMSGVGEFGNNNSLYSCDVVLGHDDPLNPFKHAFHPDHDNLGPDYLALPVRTNSFGDTFTSESFSVTRKVQLQFASLDPHNLALAGWGENQLGGAYRETITGLHKSQLILAGSFRLQQASRVSVLNDGL